MAARAPARQPARHPQVQRHTGADYEAGRVHGRNEAQPLLGQKGVLQPPQGAPLGPGKGPTEVIRMGRGGSQWKTIKQFPSWKEAQAAMRKGTIEGKWEWASNSSSPITGRRAYYKCAAHVDCEVRLCLQVQEEADDQVVASIDESKEHSEEARTKKRKNSPLTYEQEEKIRQQPSRTPRSDYDILI